MKTKQLPATINFDAITNEVARSVRITSEVVSEGLKSFQHHNFSRPASPPGTQITIRNPSQPPTSSEGIRLRRNECSNFILACGFRELANGIRRSLEHAGLCLYLTNRQVSGRAISNIAPSDIKAEKSRLEGKQLPKLINEVETLLQTQLRFRKEIESIQKLRNSLEHRNGVVGRTDCNEEERTLVVAMPTIEVIGTTPEGDKVEVEPGTKLSGGTQVFYGISGRAILAFEKGETVRLPADTFNNFAFGASIFAHELKEQALSVAKQSGIKIRRA